MKAKWYIGALVVILTMFGISQENLMVPNQEIVLQFSNAQVSSIETDLAIANVKKQLEIIGVSKVNIHKKEDGRLIISYYSNTAIDNVKEIFFTQTHTVDYTTNTASKHEFIENQTYNLDVFEIQESSDTGFGATGKSIFIPKQDYDRFSSPNFYVYLEASEATNKKVEIAVAYKLNKTIAIAINSIPHKIPEGRAGPIS